MNRIEEVAISDEGCTDKVDLLAKVVATLHRRAEKATYEWGQGDRRNIRIVGPRRFKKDGREYLVYTLSYDRSCAPI